MKKFGILFLLPLTLVLALSACKEDDGDDIDFDKGPIMSNLADNYIIPAYDDLSAKTDALQAAWNNFVGIGSVQMLDAAKTALTEATISFHKVKIFDVGPAMTNGLMSALGTFPADTTQIKNNITAGTYTLTTADNIDAIGFDALDYLFYRADAFNLLNESATQQYVTDLIAKMKSEVDFVVNGWTTYRSTFVAGVGTASTDPFAILVNAWCRDFELAKTLKLGIPIGNQTLGIQQPHYLEARRSGIGQLLLQTNIEAVHAVFKGTSYNGAIDGIGYEDYLNAIEKNSLATTINSRFDYMKSHPNSWSGGIEGMMTNDAGTLTAFYDYMQGTVVYMKTDLSSAFGVLITYQDNDGD